MELDALPPAADRMSSIAFRVPFATIIFASASPSALITTSCADAFANISMRSLSKSAWIFRCSATSFSSIAAVYFSGYPMFLTSISK